MLTPTDQPLDKLEDLTSDEMYVLLFRKKRIELTMFFP